MALQNFLQDGIMTDGDTLDSVSEDAVAGILAVAIESASTDEEMEELEESYQTGGITAVTEGAYSPVMERSIVKLDKKAQKQKAYKMAILQVEKDKSTKEYKQWCTVKKLERLLMDKMEKRSAQKAKAYMRKAAQEADKSKKFASMKKASNVLTYSEKRTQRAMKSNNNIPSGLRSKAASIANKFNVG